MLDELNKYELLELLMSWKNSFISLSFIDLNM